jgi:phosphoglycolate phosphatase
MSVRPTVVLFDIDGTLLDCGGAGRRAVSRAFLRLHGRSDAVEGLAFGGKTDPWIFDQGARRIGVEPTAHNLDALLAAYLELLDEELGSPPGYRVHAGADAAIDRAETSGHAVGIGTGNVRSGATIKLRRAGLDARFPFGGFGCDAPDRPGLLRAGARRGAERLGVAIERCRVVVIGDTPDDVSAARAIGAEVIGVTTGSFAAAALEGADVVVDRLDAPGLLERLGPG